MVKITNTHQIRSGLNNLESFNSEFVVKTLSVTRSDDKISLHQMPGMGMN